MYSPQVLQYAIDLTELERYPRGKGRSTPNSRGFVECSNVSKSPTKGRKERGARLDVKATITVCLEWLCTQSCLTNVLHV